MMNFLSPITDFLKVIFDYLHNVILTVFHMEPSGASYVLAITTFTIIIRVLILPFNIKASKSNARMQEVQPELNARRK
ncbi:membrane protein insertase YidC, partial [Clostridium perfringens]|uniref:YidC/Oxa1 family membrane protein insertase n=1 Tax=Clostridium perfringens TaxID=1502 RepID=UPI002AC6DE20